MNKKFITLLFFLILIFLISFLYNQNLLPNIPFLSKQAFRWGAINSMGTRIEILVPKKHYDMAAKIIFHTFRDVDARMSEWKPSSPLAAINHAAGIKPIPIPKDLFQLIQKSITIAQLSNGAFDPSWAALWGVWNFKKHRKPSLQEIRSKLPLINYKLIQLDPKKNTVFLPKKGMKLGLGAIAKGYALKLSAEQLHKKGLHNFLLSSGGQILASGLRNGRKWRIGIRDPRGKIRDYFAVLKVTNTSISTSGDYERFFFLNGKRYHHIIDPKTGFPARGIRSVTTICPDATLADALSTAIMVLGPKKGLALASQLKNVEAVIVDQHGHILRTKGTKTFFSLLHPPKP